MSHRLAVATVVYKNYSILSDFFASFEKQSDKNFTVYVVDLTENPQTFAHPDFVEVIYGQNRGYAHGLNCGLRRAIEEDFTRFVVINSDTVVESSFIESVKKRLVHSQGSIVGGKIYYYPGYEYHKDRYSRDQLGGVIWYAGGSVDWDNVQTIHRGVDVVGEKKYSTFEKTDIITGCLMCFDKVVIDKIGFIDESYFLYYEDADWCERARRAGIPLYYDPEIIIWHKNAQSTGGSGSQLHKKYQDKNRIKFGLKYAPVRTKIHLLKNYLLRKN